MDSINSIKPLFIGIAAVVVAVVGITAWQIGYRQGARSATPGGGITNLPQITDIRAINGTVEEVGESSIKVKVLAGPAVPSKNLETRTVEIGENTAIEKVIQKDPVKFNKEMEAFFREIGEVQPGETPPPSPEPVTREKISIRGIKVGDMVTVTSTENIIKASKFTAETISVQEAMKTTAPTIPAVPGTTGAAPVPR